ncbi:class I SAM-dependent DNA methyltransferase [Stackebrandtia soli]|uniref:class I SAM-dependent DNA methyltransferase n=1 Tax=Stackebrandtia soli TaxID=1892856 RepID=UPI0039E8F4FF
MTMYDSITNGGEYFANFFLAELLPDELKKTVCKQWTEAEGDDEPTPRTRLRRARSAFPSAHLGIRDTDDDVLHRKRLREWHDVLITGLGATEPLRPAPGWELYLDDDAHPIPVVHAEKGIIVIEGGDATGVGAAFDVDDAALLLDPATVDGERYTDGPALITRIFASAEAPRYVLMLCGAVVVLADQTVWGNGKYLAVDLDVAFGRNDTKNGGELDLIAGLFSIDMLRTPEEGGEDALAAMVTTGTRHAEGVSSDLREGLRRSVELIANEVLTRFAAAGVEPDAIDTNDIAADLTAQSLRYLYRILFLLYAEARPELGILPVDSPEYVEGYGMARLGDLVVADLDGLSDGGFHLYESLDLLFRNVNKGNRTRGDEAIDEHESEGEGLRFEALRAELFEPDAVRLIGHEWTNDNGDVIPDTRLRNRTLHAVLRLLMLSDPDRKRKRGASKSGSRFQFISYAQLSVNQLGAVYEGIMSYKGRIAERRLVEVAKGGDPKDGSWLVPHDRRGDYADTDIVTRPDPFTGALRPVDYRRGEFVFRLAGRDRQTSASYYTPVSLTRATVQLTIDYRIKEQEKQGGTVTAHDVLSWRVCEPALGSGAFLNEAIDQLGAKYLELRQAELGVQLDPERYKLELAKVKAHIALHNAYGVDLNATAVELAEVSLWLNTMHPGLQEPWFGLHLKRGNSLVGARRACYDDSMLDKRRWLKEAPIEHPFGAGELPAKAIHHFLLPSDKWGTVAGEKEAKNLAPDEAKALDVWRKRMRAVPNKKQRDRLRRLAGCVEYLWGLVKQRLELSETEIARAIDVWRAELPGTAKSFTKEQVLDNLTKVDGPYNRLKTLMDAWTALWFWPLHDVDLLDGTSGRYADNPTVSVAVAAPSEEPAIEWPVELTYQDTLFGPDPNAPEPISFSAKSRVSKKPDARMLRLREQIPLADLDDWLAFAEAVVGSALPEEGTLFNQFASLATLDEAEKTLPSIMGMTSMTALTGRFPWYATVIGIVKDQGFFHWELDYAHVFEQGGFDLQVGNPPWVRPDWDEKLALAEFDPWFALTDKPAVAIWRERKTEVLADPYAQTGFLDDLTATAALSDFLADITTYPVMTGTRPDLYRCFMVRAWANLGQSGTAGLIHPGTHFSGQQEGRLRAAAYRHLRLHAGFVNVANWAFANPVSRKTSFGMHIYSGAQDIAFKHLSELYAASVALESFTENSENILPSIKYRGEWDRRPHITRIVDVNLNILKQWNKLSGNPDVDSEQSPLLNLVTTAEQGAIEVFANASGRLWDLKPRISSGYNEKIAKDQGIIVGDGRETDSWSDVILQGPHFGIATPFNKQPNIPCTSNSDYRPWDLTSLSSDVTPVTNYVRACEPEKFVAAQDRWVDHDLLDQYLADPSQVELARLDLESRYPGEPITDAMIRDHLTEKSKRPYTDFYRMAWREMIPLSTERSLFAALIPPGPAHIHAVRSLAGSTPKQTASIAAYFSALPMDYLLRIAGIGHLDVGQARTLLVPNLVDHALTPSLLLRTLRLNCLTNAYAPLWSELFDDAWATDSWAVDWPGLEPLTAVGSEWRYETPLRTEYARRAALVELDALVSVMLGITADQLVAIYRSRFSILSHRESMMYFDADGRKIAESSHTHGVHQTKTGFAELMAHLEDGGPPPKYRVDPYDKSDRPELAEYQPFPAPHEPFYKADREREMRAAHAEFTRRLAEAEGAE